METFRQIPGSILATVMFFVLGETGFVRKESSFAAAWVVGLLVVGAVVLGAPDRVEARACDYGPHYFPNCTNFMCNQACEIYYDCDGGFCVGGEPSDLCACYTL